MSTINPQSFINSSLLTRSLDTAGRGTSRTASSSSDNQAANVPSTPSSARDMAAAIEQQNRAAAVAEITSIDLADAATQFVKFGFQANAHAATQAHANLAPESVLRLLQS